MITEIKIKTLKANETPIRLLWRDILQIEEYQKFKKSTWLLSCVWLFPTKWTIAHQTKLSMGLSQQNTEVGCHFFLQELFQTQGLNPHHLHCRWILYNCATRYTICMQIYTSTHMTKTKLPNKSVAFSSVAQSCLTHCHPMICSMPGFPVHCQLLDLA